MDAIAEVQSSEDCREVVCIYNVKASVKVDCVSGGVICVICDFDFGCDFVIYLVILSEIQDRRCVKM